MDFVRVCINYKRLSTSTNQTLLAFKKSKYTTKLFQSKMSKRWVTKFTFTARKRTTAWLCYVNKSQSAFKKVSQPTMKNIKSA